MSDHGKAVPEVQADEFTSVLEVSVAGLLVVKAPCKTMIGRLKYKLSLAPLVSQTQKLWGNKYEQKQIYFLQTDHVRFAHSDHCCGDFWGL